MITRANFLFSKVGSMRAKEIAQLEQLNAERNQVLKLEAEKKAALAETQVRLAQMAAFNQEDLKLQALVRGEENKRQRLSTFENKLRSYKRQV